MLLDPFGNLGEVLVLLPDVVTLAQVDEVDNGLRCEEEEGVDGLDLYDKLSADASIVINTHVVGKLISQSSTFSQDTSALMLRRLFEELGL